LQRRLPGALDQVTQFSMGVLADGKQKEVARDDQLSADARGAGGDQEQGADAGV